MKKLYLVFVSLIMLVTTNAYGHWAHSPIMALPIGINDETYSASEVSTDSFFTVEGVLVNRSEREYILSPSIFVDSNIIGQDPFLYDVNKLLYDYYPLYRDQSSWGYFRIEVDLPKTITLEPHKEMKFTMKLYPLKEGTYHVHSFFLAESGGFLAPGQTIIVTGSSAPTVGEITHLYLPFSIGIAAFAVMILRARFPMRADGAVNKGIRLYFAVKSTLETILVVGILFWLASTDLSFYSLAKQASIAGMFGFLVSIVATGYVSSVAFSRWKLFVIGNAVASIVLYAIIIISAYELSPMPLSPSRSDVFIQWLGLMNLAVIVYMAIWGRRQNTLKHTQSGNAQ